MRFLLSLKQGILYCCAFWLSGCTYDHALEKSELWAGRLLVTPHFDIERLDNSRFLPDTRFYIPFIPSLYGVKADVPQMEHVCGGVRQYYPRTWCSLRPESIGEAFVNASQQGAHYLLQPQLLYWNDKQNGWIADDGLNQERHPLNFSGVDRIVVRVTVYDVYSRAIYDVIELKGRSAMLQGYFQKPVDLFYKAYAELAESLATQKVL